MTRAVFNVSTTQYRLSGTVFTGQKTQPTVSKYWRKRRYKSKENPEKQTTEIQQYNKHNKYKKTQKSPSLQ